MNNADKMYARLRFKNKVYESQGQAFEDFFVLIMTKVYENFQPVRAYGRIGDKKNDGFDKTTGVYYQVFSPDDITKKGTINDAVSKLDNDFRGLYESWNDCCPIKKYYFVIYYKYKGIDPLITQKVIELNNEFNDVDIDVFLAKDLQREFEKLNEVDVMEIIGFIPSVSLPSIEYGALGDVVTYLTSIELPESKNEKLVVPDFNEKIMFNGLSEDIKIILQRGSYQEGILERYFNENPGLKEVLQEKFNALYLKSCEKISDSEEKASNLRFFYILDESCPKRTISIKSCIEVLMAYYFSTCDIFEEPQ